MSDGWVYQSLDALVELGWVELGRGKVISKIDLAQTPGAYPVYSSAKEADGKFGEYGLYMFDEELITWSVDGGGHLFHRPKHRFSVTNVGGTLRILRGEKLDYRFLYYMLSYVQSTIPFDWVLKAHPSVLRRLYTHLPVPPLPEQKCIVAILDEAFAGIAAATANAEKNLANARELFDVSLEAIFTNKGAGWAQRQFSDICEITSKLVDPREPNFIDLPHLGAGNMVSKTGELIEIKTAREEELKSGKGRVPRSGVRAVGKWPAGATAKSLV